jgi:hypothetical protein
LLLYCPNCNFQISGNTLFCVECGVNLQQAFSERPAQLSQGEKFYLILMGIAFLLEIITYQSVSLKSDALAFNPLILIAPILLGYFKHENSSKFGNFSKPFKKSIPLLILVLGVIFVWESNSGNPLSDIILIIIGPFIFLIILIALFVVNWVGYTIGHLIYKLRH